MTPEPAKFVSNRRRQRRGSRRTARRCSNRQPSTPDRSVPVPVDMRNAALTVLAVIAAVLLLQYAQAVFIPLVLGVLISYALDPTRDVAAEAPGAARGRRRALLLIPGRRRRVRCCTSCARRRSRSSSSCRRRAAAAPDAGAANGANDRRDPAGAAGGNRAREGGRRRGAAAGAAGRQRVQVEEAPINVGDYVMWGSLGIAGGRRPAAC